MRLVRIPLMTTASAETVTKWFTPVVTQLGGTIKLVALPPEVFIALPQEVAYKDLLAGWRYDLVAHDAALAAVPSVKGKELVCPLTAANPSNQSQP
jgi:hypothetical protein